MVKLQKYIDPDNQLQSKCQVQKKLNLSFINIRENSLYVTTIIPHIRCICQNIFCECLVFKMEYDCLSVYT